MKNNNYRKIYILLLVVDTIATSLLLLHIYMFKQYDVLDVFSHLSAIRVYKFFYRMPIVALAVLAMKAISLIFIVLVDRDKKRFETDVAFVRNYFAGFMAINLSFLLRVLEPKDIRLFSTMMNVLMQDVQINSSQYALLLATYIIPICILFFTGVIACIIALKLHKMSKN